MDSIPVQDPEGLAIVKVLAVVLERLVGANSHLSEGEKGQVTKFHALRAPVIGIGPYLERLVFTLYVFQYIINSNKLIPSMIKRCRIHKYASCSNECFILALIYIDRLIQRNNFLLTELNVHRVVITAILLAAKFFDDAYYNNAYYAKVGGVLVSELNSLEVEFLFRINFSLRVSPDVFEKYNIELSSHASAMGLQAPEHQHDGLLRGYPEDQSAPVCQIFEAEPLSESFVHVQPPVCEAALANHEGYYQQPQVEVKCAVSSHHITPSPPPHPPHVKGSISYASDLSGAMYEPYLASHFQAPPSFYHQHEHHAIPSNGTLLSNWTQVNQMSSTSPGSSQCNERTCSQSHQVHASISQHHENYEGDPSLVMEWQIRQSNYDAQHFVSSPNSPFVSCSQVES